MQSKSTQPAILILGPPGSGKGDQSQLAAQAFGATHISSGDEMRRANDDPAERAIMEAGDLVGEDRFQTVISRAVKAAPHDRPLILDGVAKRPGEAPWLTDFLETEGYRIVLVIHLDVTAEVANARSLSRGQDRADDGAEKQAERRRLYDEETFRSISYFRLHFPSVYIDGDDTRDAIQSLVQTSIAEALDLVG